METLETAVGEFSSLLNIASAELPLLADVSSRPRGHWSKKEILGHLIDSASNNHQRFIRGQLQDELAAPNYAQEKWVAAGLYQEREWKDLVELWLAYNRHLLHLMKSVAPARLKTIVHIDGHQPMTLELVMIDYVRHMKHHLEQIAEDAAIK